MAAGRTPPLERNRMGRRDRQAGAAGGTGRGAACTHRRTGIRSPARLAPGLAALALLVAVAWLVSSTAPALAHGGADAGSGHTPGGEHAAAHARADGLDRRWAQLTPGERRARIERSQDETRAMNARLAGARDVDGYWEPGLRALPDFAIHAVMLPTGKVLIWGREPLVGGKRSNKGSAGLFDPQTGVTTAVPPPPVPENPGPGGPMPAPIFCAGQTYLSDGRVLLAGGNLAAPGGDRSDFSGLRYTFVFDPWNEADPWTLGPKMSEGRWYPTLVRLSSGDVLILGGLDENGHGRRNGHLDIWRPGERPEALAAMTPYPAGTRADQNEFAEPVAPDGAFGMSLYPFLFGLPDGDVALAGPDRQDSAILDSSDDALPALLDRGASHGSAWRQIGGLPPTYAPPASPSEIHQGGIPLIEPQPGVLTGSWKLLAMAGIDHPVGGAVTLARTTVDRLDAHPAARAWSHDAQDDLRRGRLYANSVLLPDGGAVVVGGGVGSDDRSGGLGLWYTGDPAPPASQQIDGDAAERRQVELRNPGERGWRLGAAQREWRTYHSTAWLLPDGRVVSAGDDGNPKAIASRDDAELYWPPNLFDGDDCALRPVIRAVGATAPPAAGARQWASLGYGERFGIFSDHAQPGMRAVLVAPAATTHAVDMNQRLVALAVDQIVIRGGLNVRMPANANIAPPGYYMLFVVDADGTPSQARWVRVLQPAQAAAERGGAAPATVTGQWPQLRGRRCANPDGSQRSEPDPRDSVGPTTVMTSPADGSTVGGASVTLAASASDNEGVLGVQFRLDGASIGAEDTTAPYTISWDSRNTWNGKHALSAVARDAAGNRGVSSAVSVTVDNPPVTPPPGLPGAAALGMGAAGARAGSDPAAPAAGAKRPAKLGLDRAAIDPAGRELDVLAPITGRASGELELELQAAGERTRLTAPVDARHRRIRLQRGIPAAQARLGTGILTMRYAGNAATRPQTVRLRAAARPARLVARRPSLGRGGRLRAAGTISRRARGIVRVQLQFDAAGATRTLSFRAPIRAGRWRLDTRLDRATRDAIAARTGTLHSYTLFTGYARAGMRGEMRSLQVLGAP